MPTRNRQAGFSLLELMIVMILMMTIMAMIFTLLRGAIMTANANYEVTSAAQGLRNSQEFISRDILSGGDGLRGLANIWLPTAFATQYLSAQTAAALDPTARGHVSLGAVFPDDNIPAATNIAGSNPSKNFKPRTDRITVLTIDTGFTPRSIPAGWTDHNTGAIWIQGGDLSEFNVGEIYFLSDGTSGSFGTITRKDEPDWAIYWENGDSFGLNQIGVAGGLALATNRGANSATLTRVQMIQYFVDEDDRLIRRVFGVKNAGFADSVIAEHIYTLQFRYTLQPSGNGTLIFSQPTSRIDVAEQQAVRMVESQVIAETAYPLQDGAHHQVEGTAKLAVRNIQFVETLMPRDSEGNPAP